MLRLQMFEAAHTDQELAIEPAVAVGFSSNERMSDTLQHHGAYSWTGTVGHSMALRVRRDSSPLATQPARSHSACTVRDSS
jgi:hypothetical protein